MSAKNTKLNREDAIKIANRIKANPSEAIPWITVREVVITLLTEVEAPKKPDDLKGTQD